jgi:hypothetical protein
MVLIAFQSVSVYAMTAVVMCRWRCDWRKKEVTLVSCLLKNLFEQNVNAKS